MYKSRIKLLELHMKKIIDEKYNNTEEFLLIGNDSTLSDLNFNKIRNEIIKVSVNRTWMLFMPDIMYVIDEEIFKEIENNIESKKLDYIDFKDTIIFYNFYLKDKFNKLLSRLNSYPVDISRNNSIYAITKFLFNNYSNSKFYFYGMRLKYNEEKNHFWNKSKEILNNRTVDWEIEKLNECFLKFKNLINSNNVNAISIMIDSKLNEIINKEDIEIIYNKYSKKNLIIITPVNIVFRDFSIALMKKIVSLTNYNVYIRHWKSKDLTKKIIECNIIFVIQIGILKKLKKNYNNFLNKKLIIYNTEPLELEDNEYIKNEMFNFKLKSQILDYSHSNHIYLLNLNVKNIFLPFGYYNFYEKKNEIYINEKDIDFLFFGNLTERRKKIVNRLKELKYKVIAVENIFDRNEKIKLICKSKICIDMFRTKYNSNNMHRIMELICCKAFVIAEKGNDILLNLKLKNIVILVEYDKFIEKCVKLISEKDQNKLLNFGENALTIFKKRFNIDKILYNII